MKVKEESKNAGVKLNIIKVKITASSLITSWQIDGTGCHDLRFLDVEFSANFFTLLFRCHQEALSSSLLSAIRVVSSAYLRLLIFLPAILIPA